MRRVVVTGMGMVAPTGNDVETAWQRALSAKSAVARIEQFDPEGLPVQIGAEVKDFDAVEVMGAKEARQTSRYIHFAAGAAQQAMADSGLDTEGDTDLWGCCIGVGLGSVQNIERDTRVLDDRGPRRVSPLLVPYTIPNMAAGYVAITHKLRGPNFSTCSACASGTHAIGESWMHIRSGTADVMLAGGTEAAITPLIISAFAKMRALSANDGPPEKASRPFDLNRDGFVMGEGCGLLVLEELEHARARGATIYAEVVGYGATGDGYHITKPPPGGEGARRSIRAALRSSGIGLDEVDYINAHGTSTPANDAGESGAIAGVFGEHVKNISISSTKGVTGHALGAAGGIEAVYSIMAIKNSVVPPTANYETPDPACPLDYTPNEPRERSIRHALSNSFGFGGQNATLAFSRFE